MKVHQLSLPPTPKHLGLDPRRDELRPQRFVFELCVQQSQLERAQCSRGRRRRGRLGFRLQAHEKNASARANPQGTPKVEAISRAI